jgi:hypothetical protein
MAPNIISQIAISQTQGVSVADAPMRRCGHATECGIQNEGSRLAEYECTVIRPEHLL